MACWIRGCSTKARKDAPKNLSLFTARTEQMLNNWRNSGIAARGNTEFSKKSRICELHFQKDDILREDIFHMTHGAAITVQRKIPKLKEDAVPSIFPSERIKCYRFNPIYEEMQKNQQNEGTSVAPQLMSTANTPNPISHHEQGCQTNEDNNELQLWSEIQRNLKNLTSTSEYLVPMMTDKVAMWAYWTEDLSSCKWRVVLEKNMTLHIYVGEREIDSLGGKIKGIEDIQNTLRKLSNINPCEGAGSTTCFPKDIERRQKWLEALNLQNYKLPKTAAVCSEHFKEQNYESQHSLRKLKKNAIPYLTEERTLNNKDYNINNTYHTEATQKYEIQHEDTKEITIVENIYNDKAVGIDTTENIKMETEVVHRSTSISPERIFDSPAMVQIRKYHRNEIKKLRNQLYVTTYRNKKAREKIKSLQSILKVLLEQ